MEALKHVNKHVCQDIEDLIILKGLKTDKNKGDRLRDFIEADQKSALYAVDFSDFDPGLI